SACRRPGGSRVEPTSRARTSSSSTASPTKASASGDISRRSMSGRWTGSMAGESVDIIELILPDLDGVVLLDAQADQLIQNAGIPQLGLEILQALVILHIGAGQDALQPGGVHRELVVAGAPAAEGALGRGGRVGPDVLGLKDLDGRQVLQTP